MTWDQCSQLQVTVSGTQAHPVLAVHLQPSWSRLRSSAFWTREFFSVSFHQPDTEFQPKPRPSLPIDSCSQCCASNRLRNWRKSLELQGQCWSGSLLSLKTTMTCKYQHRPLGLHHSTKMCSSLDPAEGLSIKIKMGSVWCWVLLQRTGSVYQGKILGQLHWQVDGDLFHTVWPHLTKVNYSELKDGAVVAWTTLFCFFFFIYFL